jgi:hypothetical protein
MILYILAPSPMEYGNGWKKMLWRIESNDSRTISAQGAWLARCRPGVVGHQSGFSGGSLSEVVEKATWN